MNSTEGVSVAKMAISVMLLILLLGAVVSLFWLLFRGTDRFSNDAKKATLSSSKALLADLTEQSIAADASYPLSDSLTNLKDPSKYPSGWPDQDLLNYKKIYEEHPLTTTVANAIGNYQDTDVVFVYITLLQNHDKLSELYTTDKMSLDYNFSATPSTSPTSDTVFLEYYDPSKTVTRALHEDLLAPATKRLLQYSDYRCHVETMNIKEKNGGGAESNFVGIKILILDDKGLG